MLHKGDKINNYTLEKYLGKGSFGEVWLAKKSIELSDDGILVALKFLGYQPNREKTQESFINDVKREVGTWIKASGHKNIVSVQDSFAFRDDTFVIVSDYAAGGSLGDWLSANGGKSPNLEKTVEIMSEILDGLTYLHSQQPDKIIHRDLKPDNVLFKSGVPCITDFGVSRMSQTITQSMAQVAATSTGTPLYMSPESFNKQSASPSMDIWSAGVILYQMLSGNFPYFDENPIALALEIISGKSPKPLPTNVPHEFQAVVGKALEKDVSRRFQTAEEMKIGLKEAFEVWKSGQTQPITVNPNSIQPTIVQLPSDTNIDKTKVLETAPTKHWQEIETTKQEQKTQVIQTNNQQSQPAPLTQPTQVKKTNSSKIFIGVSIAALGLFLMLSLLGLGLYTYFGNPFVGSNENGVKVANNNINANKADAATPTITPKVERKLTEIVLPNGTKLQVYPGGIEDQLVSFIQSDEYKNGTEETLKNKWFNFDDLNFIFGKTELDAKSKRQLDNITAILKAFPEVKIKIGGYTDKKGDDAANKKLSDNRAKAVKAALEKEGVGAQVPEAEGYGEERATVAETASDDERAVDRKTAVRLIKGDAGSKVSDASNTNAAKPAANTANAKPANANH